MPETVAQCADAGHRRQIDGENTSCPETYCKQCALCAGASSALMPCPMDQRFKLNTAAKIQGADALGRVKLMASNREQIDAELVDARWNFSDRLCCVGMEQNLMLARDHTDFRDRLDRTDFIVGMHDADENGAICNRTAHCIRIDSARAISRQISHPRAHLLQELARSENGRMLDPGRDDVLTLAPECEVHTLEREIVRFAAPTREYDLV